MTSPAPTPGQWTGTNSFRLMPSDDLVCGTSTATTQSEANGFGSTLRYTWVHPQDGPQSGALLVGSPGDDGALTAAWIDSWHQKPELRLFSGSVKDQAVDLTAEWAPGWWWTIAIRSTADELRMVMECVVPQDPEQPEAFSGPYVVMESTWMPQCSE